MSTRQAIVAETRRWIGTPYHHQASVLGVGADCLGLVRGVYRNLYGPEPEKPPNYSPSWGEADGRELLLEAAHHHLTEVQDWGLGDVLIFRVYPGMSAKHCAIVSGEDAMIHAYSTHTVLETAIGPWWRRRIVSAFKFPGIE